MQRPVIVRKMRCAKCNAIIECHTREDGRNYYYDLAVGTYSYYTIKKHECEVKKK